MEFKRHWGECADIEMDEIDREAITEKHIGWNEKSGPYYYSGKEKVLLHRWIYHRILEEERERNGWQQPRRNLKDYSVIFKDFNKKNCRRSNLDIRQYSPRREIQLIPVKPGTEQVPYRYLLCKKAGVEILVDLDNYNSLCAKYLVWDKSRGASFYENGKKIYVHRWIMEQQLLEEGYLSNLKTFPEDNVSFINNDKTDCRKENLFIWKKPVIRTRRKIIEAKKQALESIKALKVTVAKFHEEKNNE